MNAERIADEIELEIEPADFEARLKRGERLLISFGATWCGPCKQLLPTLRQLAAALTGDVGVGRIETDLHPGVEEAWKIAAYPTLVLFANGKEQARLTGLQTLGFLKDWVARKLPPQVPTGGLSKLRPDWGAFYGNTMLRDSLFAGLRQLAAEGKLARRQRPGWYGEAGSISGALVRSSHPIVFERITGLPYSFAAALELIGTESEAELQRLTKSLEVDLDVAEIYLRLLTAWLGDEAERWAEFIPVELNGQRLRWLAAMQTLFDGGSVKEEVWKAIHAEATLQAKALHETQTGFWLGRLIADVSPPPALEAPSDRYGRQDYMVLRLRNSLSQRQAGVTPECLALDQKVHEWFLSQWTPEAFQALPEEERNTAHSRLKEVFAEQFAARDAFEVLRKQAHQACNTRLFAHLVRLLGACPKIQTNPAGT